MSRFELTFGALIAVQAVHSIEEYVGRLWESFPPAHFVTGLVSEDHERGFVILNLILLIFGFWCFFFPVRRHWTIAASLVWLWIAIEIVNGLGHPLWAVLQRAYTPGLVTAPVLFILAIYLANLLRRQAHVSRTAV